MYFLGVRRQYAAESGGTGGAEAEIIPFEPEPGNTGVEKKSLIMKKMFFTLASAALGCAGAWAAEGATEATAADSSIINLRSVEVLANRATASTPVAFTDVRKDALEKANDSRDMPYLLGMTPSLLATSDAGAGMGYTSIRLRGSDASRINITANGVPVNDAESHRVYWVNMPDIASSVRSVQIQRGAGTSANGAGAFGGSVNLLTDAPSFDPYAEFAGSYGMYNTNKETLRVGSGLLGGHWSADARISHAGSDGYIDRAFSKLWSYFGQVAYVNGPTSLRLLAFGGKEQTYMAWDYASREQMEKYGRRYNPCGEYTDSEGRTAYYPNQTDNYRQHNFQLHWGQAFGSEWHLNVALHYTKGDGYYEQYKVRRSLVEYGLRPFTLDGGETVTKSDLITDKSLDNGFGGGIFALRWRHGRVDATLGGSLNNYRGHHFGTVEWVRTYTNPLDPSQEFYRHLGTKLDGNIYARATVDAGRGFNAFADLQWRGIRYKIHGTSDNYDYAASAPQMLDIRRTYSFFNPKVGLSWASRDRRHRAFASWSVAHKEPTHDNFTDASPGRLPEAERMFDYELGYTFAIPVLTAGVNLYMMDYRNQLVVTGELSDTGNPMSVNVPDSYRMGIELQAALRPVDWFDWQINATLSRNRIKDFTEYIYNDDGADPITVDCGDTPIAFSPGFTLNNAFNFRWRGLDASLESHYVGKQYMTNSRVEELTLKHYFFSDLRLGWTFRNLLRLKELRLGVAVYNIFNAKYENNGYAGSGYYTDSDGQKVIYRYSGYAAQAPAHVMASVNIRF